MKAAAYARYSTDKQQKNSIEYQLTEIRKYCVEKGITITATFTNEAESGTNMDRPGFQAMVAGAYLLFRRLFACSFAVAQRQLTGLYPLSLSMRSMVKLSL